MIVHDIFKSVRPITYDNHDEQWRYSTFGSAVVLGCGNRFYAVTAAHVPTGYNPNQILIPYEEGSEAFLPVREAFTITTDENQDTDHKDVLFLEIWQQELDRNLWKPDYCFNLASNDRAVTTSESKYWFSGYPSENNEVDYEQCALFHQSTHISGRITQKNKYLGIDAIEFESTEGLTSLSGYSGGGAFSFTPIGEGLAHVRFEGIILRATIESKRGYILQADFMRNYILRQQRG